jgi:hypothetical protein
MEGKDLIMTIDSDHIDIGSHVQLVGEAHDLRGKLRAAADAGDIAEALRLGHRMQELELELFIRKYVDVRHGRARNGRLGGYSPDLEQVEAQLSERLAKLGVPSHRPRWQ